MISQWVHSNVSNGNTNEDFRRDTFTAEALYAFGNKIVATHGMGPVYQDSSLVKKEAPVIENDNLPVIGSFTRESSEILDQFTVLDIHLWSISPEYLPDELIVKIEDEDGVIYETLYNYKDRDLTRNLHLFFVIIIIYKN